MATLEMLPLPPSAIAAIISDDEIPDNNVLTPTGNHTLNFLNLIQENSLKLDKFGSLEPSSNVPDAKFEDHDSSVHKKPIPENPSIELVGLYDANYHSCDHMKQIEEGPSELDKFEIDEDDKKLINSLDNVVPRKRRTCRFIAGKIVYNSEKGLYYYDETNLITNKEKLRKSKKRSRGDDYAEPSKKKKQSSKKFQHCYVFPDPPPELPHWFRDYIEKLNLDMPPLFVGEKILTPTDLKPQQSRLSLSKRRVNKEFITKFLTEDEKEALKNRQHIEVKLVDDNMNEYNTLHFTRWEMSGSMYVLTTGWNKFASDNELREDMMIRVWCFRMGSKICFCFSVDRDSIEENQSI